MVEDVKGLGAKLQPGVFGELELPVNGQIDLPCAKSSQDVAAKIASQNAV
jgi:hypothetical protein